MAFGLPAHSAGFSPSPAESLGFQSRSVGIPISKHIGTIFSAKLLPKDCYLCRLQGKKIRKNCHCKYRQTFFCHKKERKWVRLGAPLAYSEDGFINNAVPHLEVHSIECEEVQWKLSTSLPFMAAGVNLLPPLLETVQSLHIAMENNHSLTKGPWFAKAWLGIDQNAMTRSMAYQAAVHAFLQAAVEVASTQRKIDADALAIAKQSLLQLRHPLEDSLRCCLSSKGSAVDEWFWYHQHPLAVQGFTVVLENSWKCISSMLIECEKVAEAGAKQNGVAVLMLTINVCSALLKMGPSKLSLPEFSSSLSRETGNLMTSLADYIALKPIYCFASSIGLAHDFLSYFGSRAALLEQNTVEEERRFWVNLIQHLLRVALAREGLFTSLISSVKNEQDVEQDIAIFGFFAALGRRARILLMATGISSKDSTLSLFRYLEGGCLLFYPQLENITAYQLFVEVACEELKWLPIFSETSSSFDQLKSSKIGRTNKEEVRYVLEKKEVLRAILNICSQWVKDFLHYNSSIEQTGSNAVKFLAKIEDQIVECIKAHGNDLEFVGSKLSMIDETYIFLEEAMNRFAFEDSNLNGSGKKQTFEKKMFLIRKLPQQESSELEETQLQILMGNLKILLKDMQTMDGILTKLEVMLIDLEFSDQSLPKEHLKAMISQLQNIQQNIQHLRLETNAVELSFASTESKLEQEEDNALSMLLKKTTKFNELCCQLKELNNWLYSCMSEIQSTLDHSTDDLQMGKTEKIVVLGQENKPKTHNLREMINNSVKKLKSTSMDVLKGTQLLGTDVSVAVALLRKSVTGHQLTQRERKNLRRTLTDLASVVPIGVLMLLPVTAVGHAAILAAIQKYIPALIPSAYASERLDIVKQLDHMKQAKLRKNEAVLVLLGNGTQSNGN